MANPGLRRAYCRCSCLAWAGNMAGIHYIGIDRTGSLLCMARCSKSAVAPVALDTSGNDSTLDRGGGDGKAVIEPILENRGNAVAERKYLQFNFPPELEPSVKSNLYHPPGGMIRELTPDLRSGSGDPGVLVGWVKTVVFPGTSLQLDRIYLTPIPGKHRMHYKIIYDHGSVSGDITLRFGSDAPAR